MTSWAPDLRTHPGPRYLAIADRLATDVAVGRLKPGDRLPTHRDLAWRLGVTVGTVTRAYAEAERRGLIAGEVGRGTFIRERTVETPPSPPAAADGFVDLARNFPPGWENTAAIADAFTEVARSLQFGAVLGYVPNLGLAAHRESGARWLARHGLDAPAAQVAVTDGAQNAMMLALAALTRPGDVVLSEQLTFYGLKSAASLLSLKLHGVPMDEHGLLPSALDLACRQMAPKALYCIPTLHNPTTITTPAERRAEIAAVCRRHNVAIVEDDIYSFLAAGRPAPLSSFAPERSVFLTSLSKCVAPGLRIGFLWTNDAVLERVAAALRASAFMATPVAAAVADRLIRSGEALRIAAQMRDEAAARQAIAARVLAGLDYDAQPASFHVWLRLPEPWRREEFTEQVHRRGVGVAPADAFAVGRAQAPHAVRVGLSAARDRAQLEGALDTIRSVLRDASVGAGTLV